MTALHWALLNPRIVLPLLAAVAVPGVVLAVRRIVRGAAA